MNNSDGQFEDVDDYIAKSPADVQDTLRRIRATVRKAAPDAVESISYGMPAYKLNGKPLVYFAAFPHHIGFYATPQGHEAFSKELAKYKQGKGSVQFPLDQPMPYELIDAMTTFKKDLLTNKDK